MQEQKLIGGKEVSVDVNRVVAGHHVYAFSGATWVLEAVLATCDPEPPGSGFGRSVSISDSVIVVGTYECLSESCGAAYFFRLMGNQWIQVARTAGYHALGVRVSVTGDTAIVGMPSAGFPKVYSIGGLYLSDCNSNQTSDDCDIRRGLSSDRNRNCNPDDCEFGACCDPEIGRCREPVLSEACDGEHQAFTLNVGCADLSAGECEVGACCDAYTGACEDFVFSASCRDEQQVWSLDVQCDDLDPLCPKLRGACCDHATGFCWNDGWRSNISVNSSLA